MEAVEKFKRVLEEVKRTNATATRSAGTDFRCRDWFTEHGDEILALLTSRPETTTDTAWAVLDMDGGAFHSVHIFKEDADRASFGLGSVVPLRYYGQ